jgi:MoaA/NifB/PqqE/SkfB family radical SAM enzyme
MGCRHCWYHDAWKAKHLKPIRLRVSDYERLARSIDRIAFLSLTGGEAFANPELVAIVDAFARGTRLVRYEVPTSGFHTDRVVGAAEQLLRAHSHLPFRVDVSLDGMRDTHETIRNMPGSFDRACHTIRELNLLRKRYSWFDVGVITTLSHHNQSEVRELASLVESVHPEGEWMVNIVRGQPRDDSAKDIDLSAYRLAHELIRERVERGRMVGHRGHVGSAWLSAKNATRRQLIMDTIEDKRAGGGCAAGSLGGVIHTDGSVWACELVHDKIGYIQDFGFDLPALWNSPEAHALRQRIQETRCQCTQECFLSVSVFLQPSCWPQIVRERLRLG